MAWKHEFSTELQILFVAVTGLVDRASWEHQLRVCLREANSHSCYRFLVDYRAAELRLSRIDLFDRPTFYQEVGMPRAARIAIMFPPTEKDTKFIESVADNRGYSVRAFENSDEAIAWLRRETTQPDEHRAEKAAGPLGAERSFYD